MCGNSCLFHCQRYSNQSNNLKVEFKEGTIINIHSTHHNLLTVNKHEIAMDTKHQRAAKF